MFVLVSASAGAGRLPHIVSSADDTRRRIVRDLYDGTQQRLVHTIITLELARRSQESHDRNAATALVGEALEHAKRANGELRELVHGILPSVLQRGGLIAAVDQLVTRMRVYVEVRDDGVGGATPDGTGLRGLGDRVAALGGQLQITSPIGAGTHLAARLPRR